MTTIIIIVVVALVFFVTVCVVTFMVWKREAEMRTDSIRAIEDNLQRLEDRLAVETQPEEQTPLQEDLHEDVCRPVLRAAEPAVAGRSRRSRSRSRSRDPFSWVRSEQEMEETSQTEAQQPEQDFATSSRKLSRLLAHGRQKFLHSLTVSFTLSQHLLKTRRLRLSTQSQNGLTST